MSLNLRFSIIRASTYKFSLRVGRDRNNGTKRCRSWPLKITKWEKKSAFKNEIHGGGKRYRCCDRGKLAIANIPLSTDRNYSFAFLISKISKQRQGIVTSWGLLCWGIKTMKKS